MKTLKNKWFVRVWALSFLALGFCTIVPPAQAQRVKATFSENNTPGPDLIFLLEELQPDGITWEIRYSSPSSPMIFEETPGIHVYRVKARFVSLALNSGPSNEASIELFSPPNTPGMDSFLKVEQTSEPVNVNPPPNA